MLVTSFLDDSHPRWPEGGMHSLQKFDTPRACHSARQKHAPANHRPPLRTIECNLPVASPSHASPEALPRIYGPPFRGTLMPLREPMSNVMASQGYPGQIPPAPNNVDQLPPTSPLPGPGPQGQFAHAQGQRPPGQYGLNHQPAAGMLPPQKPNGSSFPASGDWSRALHIGVC